MDSVIQDYEDKLKKANAALAYKFGVRDRVKLSIQENEARLKEISKENDLFTKASVLLGLVSEHSRKQVTDVFETMVTEALQVILEKPYLQFKVHYIKGKRPDTVFKLLDTKLGKELDVLKSFGGGVKDVVSTILRIMVLELHKPKVQGPIILDEVGRNISKEYQENFGQFLQQLSEKLGKQIILITHSPLITQAADKVIQVSQDSNGRAIVQ